MHNSFAVPEKIMKILELFFSCPFSFCINFSGLFIYFFIFCIYYKKQQTNKKH